MILLGLLTTLLTVLAITAGLLSRRLQQAVDQLALAAARTEALGDAGDALQTTLDRARARRRQVRDSVPHPDDR